MAISPLSEKCRFWFAPVVLCGYLAFLAVRISAMHMDLLPFESATPDYGYNSYTKGLRGGIYSSGGIPFARSSTVWEYRLDPKAALNSPRDPRRPVTPEERRAKMEKVAETFGLDIEKVAAAYANVRNRYQLLATGSDQRVHDEVAANRKFLPELRVVEKHVRIYPQGRRLSHVLGFVSRDPTNSVGAAGLEQRFETYLMGTTGRIHGGKDARGREVVRERDLLVEAKDGCDVHLTIDHNIQLETEKALREGIARHKAEAAWAIVMSVTNGAILAMASLPDYDPSEFTSSGAFDRMNRAISENYEPGSVMKTITACAALNERTCTAETMINTSRSDPRYFRLPGDAGHKWEEYMSVRDALVHSSNIVFGKIGADLGPRRLYEYMRLFGFGAQTGVELPGEQFGILPFWRKWDKIKWSRAPIGQGVAVTALQLAAAYAAIGNDGVLVKPHLVEKIVEPGGETIYRHAHEEAARPVTAATARSVRAMMVGVAKKGGTARRAAIPGYTVAGKTGTAQMKEGKGYSSTDYNASFIGIVPATRPAIVVLVTYQKPLYCRSRKVSEAEGVPLFNHQGGLCAAPTFRQIAEVSLRYLQVEPDVPEEWLDADMEESAQ